MGMSVGGGGGHRAEINVTPMIDVLLVLIIIFMVITPVAQHGLKTEVPQQSTANEPPAPKQSTELVVSVTKNDGIQINQERVERADLPARLTALHNLGGRDHLFVRGDRDLDYEAVATVIDIALGAGWYRIGLMTR